MGLPFEWDSRKSASNAAKHGLSFEEAVAVFADAGRADLDATHQQDGEDRRKAVGSINGRLFTVVYTFRGETMRIISARPANSKEIRQHDNR